MNPVDALKNELREITDLKGAVALMHWDMETYMPPGGAKHAPVKLQCWKRWLMNVLLVKVYPSPWANWLIWILANCSMLRTMKPPDW